MTATKPPEWCGCGARWPCFGLTPPLVREPVALCFACWKAHPVNQREPGRLAAPPAPRTDLFRS